MRTWKFSTYRIFREHLNVTFVARVEKYRSAILLPVSIIYQVSDIERVVNGEAEVVDLKDK